LLPEKGFHVARALVGSESTCVLVLRAKLRLIPSPQGRALLVIGYPDVYLAADHVVELQAFQPIALEAFHEHVIENMERKGRPVKGKKLLPEGHCWLLVEFGGQTPQEAADKARAAQARIEARGGDHMGMKVLDDHDEQQAVWKVRESGVGASRI